MVSFLSDLDYTDTDTDKNHVPMWPFILAGVGIFLLSSIVLFMRYKLKFKKIFKNKTNYAIKYVNATSHDPLATDRNEDEKKEQHNRKQQTAPLLLMERPKLALSYR